MLNLLSELVDFVSVVIMSLVLLTNYEVLTRALCMHSSKLCKSCSVTSDVYGDGYTMCTTYLKGSYPALVIIHVPA